jgi:hypothetical protein
MPASIRSTFQNGYNQLFISILAYLFPINLNINCYYAIKVIETIK